MKLCDLHTHSTFSDGTFCPEETIDSAIEKGLSAVALTDHNTISGLDRFVSYAENKPIDVVPGIEFSTNHNGAELHILGLFVKPESYDAITQFVEKPNVLKEESNLKLAKKLNENNYAFDYEELKRSAPGGRINRANIAKELLKLGLVKSMDEAFDTILSPDYGWYEPPERLSSLETIEFISLLGAVPVWAHPLINADYEECEAFIKQAKKRGLIGMETLYSLYSEADTKFAAEMCRKYGLLQSGGSDFHGTNKPDISLGSGKGNLEIPYEFYEKLKAVSN